MFDTSDVGVLYSEHSGLTAMTPIASLWSYETCVRGRDRRNIALKSDGSQEYWLDRSDPLLNTILPSTTVSLVVNFGDPWTAGRSLVTSAFLPRVCVVGPFTRPRLLRVGKSVHALGAVLPSTLTASVFNVPATALVDRMVPLQDLWGREAVESLIALLPSLDMRRCLSILQEQLVEHIRRSNRVEPVWHEARQIIQRHAGGVSIADLARSHGLSRQQFAGRFGAAAGLPPKLFARITRFNALVHALLSTDVSRWGSDCPHIGFYDQAHMINEFRTFAGSSPTTFFRPHDTMIDPAMIRQHGRPSEWLRRADSPAAKEPLGSSR